MKIILASVAAVMIVLIGGFLFLNNNSSTKTELSPKTDLINKTADSKVQDEIKSEGAYVEYSAETYPNYEGQKRVLFFYANWCPTCRPVDIAIQNNQDKIPEGYTIIRINYDDNATDADEEALADEYGITYQHTFVILDEQNNVVTKYYGGDFDKLLSELNN